METHDTVNGSLTVTFDPSADSVAGDGGNDALGGGIGANTIAGGAGDDILTGGAGTDTLDGGAGDDTLHGGAGADTFKAGEGHDHITDYVKGTDVKVDISHVLDIADETVARTYMEFKTDGGKVVLEIYDNPTIHDADTFKGSVTFDNITDATDLDSLLGKIDLDHTTS